MCGVSMTFLIERQAEQMDRLDSHWWIDGDPTVMVKKYNWTGKWARVFWQDQINQRRDKHLIAIPTVPVRTYRARTKVGV